jgi:uncharacterized membrane protein YhaH (DUF805 family)
MKKIFQKYVSIQGRFNRKEFLIAQIACVVLWILYSVLIFIPVNFVFLQPKVGGIEISDFLIVLTLCIPILIFSFYFLIFNEVKRMRDICDSNLPILSAYSGFKFIPVIGWFFAIKIYTQKSHSLKDSQMLDLVNILDSRK